MTKFAGLTSQRASELLLTNGHNTIPAAAPPSVVLRFLLQFRSPLIYVLMFALMIDVFGWFSEGMGSVPVESLAIASILLLNAFLGAFQEYKADEAIAKARALGASRAWVLRDGTLQHMSSDILVPGDIVRLEAGDKVPADAELLEKHSISVDELIITGESLPVDKHVGAVLFGGTLLVRGSTYARVLRTGAQSQIGQLAHSLKQISADTTPLEKRIKFFAKQVAVIVLVLAAVLTAGGIYAEGLARINHVVMFSVALAVAAIPEGLPAVLTVALAIGVQRMAHRKALVRKMTAVETLGSVTVIATDKTGTLTENRMIVREIDSPDPERALLAMILANDADHDLGAGDSVDLALLAFAKMRAGDTRKIANGHARTSARPFDSTNKFMSVTVNDGRKDMTFLKGAPEVLLERSKISKKERAVWENKAHEYAHRGMRVLAVAWTPGSHDHDVHFLGLIVMWDPPRGEVPDAIRIAQEAGIRVVMITGDHPATAAFAAKAVGIDGNGVITGKQMGELDPDELRDRLENISVYARVLPEHKLQLVEGLKAAGNIVAVTGDGVNDALAIKRADVGIAMGQRGSDVSREVADIVLLDDNFSTIVAAIEEGRSIYENIVKFICFFLSTDVALVLLVIGGLAASFLFDLRDGVGNILLPLTAVQLLWINVVADGPAALALTLDRNPDIMKAPPRSPKSPLLVRNSVFFIAATGALKAALGLTIFVAFPHLGYSFAETQTCVFLYEASAQLVFAYPVRHLHVTPVSNRWLHLAVIGGVMVQLSAVFLAPLSGVLGLAWLQWEAIGAVAAAVLLSWGLAETVGFILRTARTGN